jgi:hypothetical protein
MYKSTHHTVLKPEDLIPPFCVAPGAGPGLAGASALHAAAARCPGGVWRHEQHGADHGRRCVDLGGALGGLHAGHEPHSTPGGGKEAWGVVYVTWGHLCGWHLYSWSPHHLLRTPVHLKPSRPHTHMPTHACLLCCRQVQGAVDIAAIAAGGFHNMALNRAGEVLTWGTNDYGQLGNGSTSYSMEPSKVGVVPEHSTGVLHAWGNAESSLTSWLSASIRLPQPMIPAALVHSAVSQHPCPRACCLGLPTLPLPLPLPLPPLLPPPSWHSSMWPGHVLVWQVVDLEEVPISDIAAGGWHSVALAADGSIIVWGRGEYGRLGIRDRTGSSKLRPFKVRATSIGSPYAYHVWETLPGC